MSVVATIIRALVAAPAVFGKTSDRIFASRAPQDASRPPFETAYPHIIVVKTSEREPYALEAATGYREARIVVMCRALTPNAADYLGNDVVAALKDYAADGVTIQRDVVDRTETVDADGKALFMRTIGFVVWY